MSQENDELSHWWVIPEPILLAVLSYLRPCDVSNASLTCKRWYSICLDDWIWKKLFMRDFKVYSDINLKPGKSYFLCFNCLISVFAGAVSWYSEYERLTTNIPLVETEVLEGHSHQVLHVAFSHNGEMFATCSKDGYVIVC